MKKTKNVHVSASVLDNKETLQQKRVQSSLPTESKSYILSLYRKRNLSLANHLKNTKYSEIEEVNKMIRSLLYCSSLSAITKNDKNRLEIAEHSKRCKHRFCAICARARSAQLAGRFEKALLDQNNQNWLKGKYFYFLTLTVKHDELTRNYNYRKEFNSYTNKLFRSKIFNQIFGSYISKQQNGYIKNIEMTLSHSTYHIHAHVLITAPRITRKISEVQKALAEKWLKITKDSNIISLDLIKTNSKKNEKGIAKVMTPELRRAVKEVLKYSAKTGTVKDLKGKKLKLFIEWLKEIKGKNFITSHGAFRNWEIATAKSKYDSDYKNDKLKDQTQIHLASTSQIKYNFKTPASAALKYLKHEIANAKIKSLPSNSLTVDAQYYEEHQIFKTSMGEREIKDALKVQAEVIAEKKVIERKEKAIRDQLIRTELDEQQLEMLRKKQTRIKFKEEVSLNEKIWNFSKNI